MLDKLASLKVTDEPRAFAETPATVKAIMADTENLIRDHDLDATMARSLPAQDRAG